MSGGWFLRWRVFDVMQRRSFPKEKLLLTGIACVVGFSAYSPLSLWQAKYIGGGGGYVIQNASYRKNTTMSCPEKTQSFPYCACPTRTQSGICCPWTNHNTGCSDTAEDACSVRISKNTSYSGSKGQGETGLDCQTR